MRSDSAPAPAPALHGRPHSMIALLGLGGLVFVSALACLVFTREIGRVAAAWPTNAIVLAALLRPGRTPWRGFLIAGLIGNLAADLVFGDTLATAFSLAACNSLEILLGAGLMRRLGGADADAGADLGRQRQLVVFLASAGVLAPLTSASAAAVCLWFLRQAPIGPTLFGWYVPDALGLLIVTPTLLGLNPQTIAALKQQVRGGRGLLSASVLALTLAVVFGQSRYPLVFLIPPALILVAFELNVAGASLGLLVTAAVAAVMTLTGHGPEGMIGGDLAERLAVQQLFLATMTVAVLPVAAALAKRQRLEAELRAALSHEQAALRFSTLAQEIAGIGQWRRERTTGATVWSDRTYAIHGMTRGDYEHRLQDSIKVFHPEDLPRMQAVIRRAFLTGEPYDLTVRLTRADDGAERMVTFKGEVERDASGHAVAVVGVMQDVTEQRAAHAALAESELRHRIIAESATDLITRTGIDGKILYASPSVFDVTGYTAQELTGRSLVPEIHPDDREPGLAVLQQMIAGERSGSAPLSYRLRHKDGHWMWIECNPTLVRDADGAPAEFVDVCRDITARVNLEAEMRAARDAAEEAAAVKSAFLANMSHEIRTPLTAILGFTSLLEGHAGLDETARTYVARVGGAGEALLSIVNDVLDFSKLEAGQVEITPRPMEPAQTLHETLLMFSPQAEAKGLTLAFTAADDLPAWVNVDPDRVRQILVNLIGNAIKFTDAGQVRVAASYDAKGQRLEVRVEDTGSGMSKAQQKKLFQRFSQVDASLTRRHGGTGLGLAICKGLAEAMGGDISVKSRKAGGSLFQFTICAPPVEAPAAHAAHGEAGVHRRLEGAGRR